MYIKAVQKLQASVLELVFLNTFHGYKSKYFYRAGFKIEGKNLCLSKTFFSIFEIIGLSFLIHFFFVLFSGLDINCVGP